MKLKIMSKNNRHNDLEVRFNKNCTAHSPARCASCKERNETMKILLANKEKVNPQIAHLVFCRHTGQT